MNKERLLIGTVVVALVAGLVVVLSQRGGLPQGVGGGGGASEGATIRAERPAVPAVRRSPVARTGATAAPVARSTPRVVGRVEGRVVDLDGKGIAGAKVLLRDATLQPVLTEVESNAEGHFEAAVKPAGYAAWAKAPGFAVSQTERFPVRAGETSEVPDLVLQPGVPLRGTVLDSQGRAIAGAQVRAFHLRMKLRRAFTDAAGHYEIADLLPETYTVVYSAEGYCTDRRKVTLTADGAEVDFTLHAPGTVRGAVLGADGRPLAGGRILVRRGENVLRKSRTRQDGTFEIGGLVAGPVTILALAEGFSGSLETTVVEGRPVEVHLVLGEGTSLNGQVLDANELPVGGLDVECSALGKEILLRTPLDPRGRFHFDDLPPGRYRLRVRQGGTEKGRTLAEHPVEVGTTPVDVRVVLPGATVKGEVRGPDGRPVPGCSVHVSGPAGIRGPARSDAEGRFEIGGIAPGPGVLLARSEDKLWVGSARVQVDGRVLAPVVVQLAPAAFLRGRVVDAEGVPQPGVALIVESVDGAIRYQLRTQATGHFATAGLPAGSYRVRLADRTVESTVHLGTGETVQRDLVRAP